MYLVFFLLDLKMQEMIKNQDIKPVNGKENALFSDTVEGHFN